MATKNLAHFLGILADDPLFTTINGQKQAAFSLYTLRPAIPTPAGEDESDLIYVSTKSAGLINQIKRLKKDDIVDMFGNFCGVDVTKYYFCKNPDCREFETPVPYKGSVSYINPIEITKVNEAAWDEIKAKMFLQQNRYHSNTIQLIGTAKEHPVYTPIERVNRQSGDKEMISLWDLRMSIKVKHLIPGSLHAKDYISVISYNDLSKIKNGDFVSIDGFVKSKHYSKIRKCPCCGTEIKSLEYSMSVIAYDYEHIRHVDD